MNKIKELRNQLRQIAKEILDEEMAKAIEAKVTARVDARLDAIEKHIKSVLEGIDSRQKDMQSYVMRQAAASAGNIKVNNEKS